MENSYSVEISELRKHFDYLKSNKQYGTISIGVNRYSQILGEINPSNEEIHEFIETMCQNENSVINPSSVAIIGESLYEYYVREEEKAEYEKKQ